MFRTTCVFVNPTELLEGPSTSCREDAEADSKSGFINAAARTLFLDLL